MLFFAASCCCRSEESSSAKWVAVAWWALLSCATLFETARASASTVANFFESSAFITSKLSACAALAFSWDASWLCISAIAAVWALRPLSASFCPARTADFSEATSLASAASPFSASFCCRERASETSSAPAAAAAEARSAIPSTLARIVITSVTAPSTRLLRSSDEAKRALVAAANFSERPSMRAESRRSVSSNAALRA